MASDTEDHTIYRAGGEGKQGQESAKGKEQQRGPPGQSRKQTQPDPRSHLFFASKKLRNNLAGGLTLGLLQLAVDGLDVPDKVA